eukprot:3934596-Rhodomonas_salina.4
MCPRRAMGRAEARTSISWSCASMGASISSMGVTTARQKSVPKTGVQTMRVSCTMAEPSGVSLQG